ncbi:MULTISPECIES: TlpA family protein disulfide reductase [Proteiniphilum]|jgi:peroxiredoxin|uniref:TlpA family protein disulfide reductase n=1 Tax=Proteiniphilum TaxID=294702 RepID=UPI001EEAAF10|nr:MULTISPECIES: TlpA disulfide reductase family protein [Proteiniphilum]ULB35249.1 TlpA family protein disulfide reductase [Proteiniphilum propionicum]
MKYVNFCLIALTSIALSAGSVKNGVPSTGFYPGEAMPDIVLTDLGGEYRNLHDYSGRKVVVNFWATYDAQSRARNVQLYNYLRMNNLDVEFLSIAFDKNRNVVQRTMALDKLENIPQFCEVKGTDSEVYKDFKLDKGFRSYLIDENGVITAINLTPDDLKNIL